MVSQQLLSVEAARGHSPCTWRLDSHRRGLRFVCETATEGDRRLWRRRDYDKAQKLLLVSQQLTETRAALSVALCIEVARISASPE